jgi:hypothetical protein
MIEKHFEGSLLAVIVIRVVRDETNEATCWAEVSGMLLNHGEEPRVRNILRTSPIPIWSLVKGLHLCWIFHTWPSEYPDQLRRASAIITDRDNITQLAFLVFPDGLEHVD